MRVLLTGATGFLGAHVLRRLLQGDADVAVLIRSRSDTWRINSLLDSVTQINGDFCSATELEDPIRDFAPDVTIHLAWTGVGGDYRNSLSQVDINLVGSINLLQVVKNAGCSTWIGLGSQAEYGPANVKLDETHFPRPTTLYGAAKLSTYFLSQQLCKELDMRFVWLRLFSAYGPMDNPSCMIPSLVLRLLAGEHISLTKGTQLWDYVYATDVADVIFLAACNANASGAFNLGSGQVQTIRSVAEQIRDLLDTDLQIGFGEIPFKYDQIMHLQADISKLQSTLAWSPNVKIEDGLRMTVAWFRENQNEQPH